MNTYIFSVTQCICTIFVLSFSSKTMTVHKKKVHAKLKNAFNDELS